MTMSNGENEVRIHIELVIIFEVIQLEINFTSKEITPIDDSFFMQGIMHSIYNISCYKHSKFQTENAGKYPSKFFVRLF
jgi:hypothetical protein